MARLSLHTPINEPIVNFANIPADWEQFQAAVSKFPKGSRIPMIIGGKKIHSEEVLTKVSPSTGESLYSFSQATNTHAQMAIDAALAAKPAWSALTPNQRIQKLRDVEFILEKWKFELCASASVECGYTAYETAVSWAELMDFVRFNNYFYEELLNEKMGDGISETNSMILRPLKGFTCAVTPFNFPIAIGFNLPLVMALTGNTVVWKPSEDAVCTSYLLMLALEAAGFPSGVINFITGEGKPCLPTVLKHPELTCLNFTGSFATARAFGNYLYNTEFQRENFPRFIAETGGKDFLVADESIDVVDTALCIVQGAFGRSGQKCSANSVLLVHENIWPELKKQLIEKTKALKTKKPFEQDADMGPVINKRAFDRIKGYVNRAKADPACTVLIGNEAVNLQQIGVENSEHCTYIPPTIIEVNTKSHELLKEEVFGPVLSVKTYKTLSEAVEIIQQHPYRLTGSVVSRNEEFLSVAVPILSQLAGNFYVNRKTTGAMVNQQPFGGDGASGTNNKAGGKYYLLNFVSQGAITRRHARTTLKSAFETLFTLK
jgi:1-pyrroline-5-carboxylate dehydrogenase